MGFKGLLEGLQGPFEVSCLALHRNSLYVMLNTNNILQRLSSLLGYSKQSRASFFGDKEISQSTAVTLWELLFGTPRRQGEHPERTEYKAIPSKASYYSVLEEVFSRRQSENLP